MIEQGKRYVCMISGGDLEKGDIFVPKFVGWNAFDQCAVFDEKNNEIPLAAFKECFKKK